MDPWTRHLLEECKRQIAELEALDDEALGSDDDPYAPVVAPCKPAPFAGGSAIALPEPDEAEDR